MATIKRTDTEAIQIKGLQMEEEGNKKESRYRGYTYQRPAKRGRRATIKIADTEAIHTKCPQRTEKGDNKVRGYRDYTDQGPAKGGEWRQ